MHFDASSLFHIGEGPRHFQDSVVPCPMSLNCYTEEDMAATIEFDDFEQVDVRVGTVLSATPNIKARNPAYVLQVDFGPLGVKTTSAQLRQNYATQDLVGRQVVAVVNFPPKLIAGIKSQVLVLAAVSEQKGTVLLQPGTLVEDGAKVA
jgi:tRNA-binding protein